MPAISHTVETNSPPNLQNRGRKHSLETFQHLPGSRLTHPQRAPLNLEGILKLFLNPARITP